MLVIGIFAVAAFLTAIVWWGGEESDGPTGVVVGTTIGLAFWALLWAVVR